MKYLLFLFTVSAFIESPAQQVFLNEIRANDAGTDDSEFVELIGPGGTDISGWSITHVNGTGGATIFSYTFPEGTIIPDDGILDTEGNSIGFIVIKNSSHIVANADLDWGPTGLQNGPDGIILADAEGNRIQALTWNGSGDLVGGDPPWRNIGSDVNDDRSLCAPDSVNEAMAASWTLLTASPGTLNASQGTGDISLPVQLLSFTAIPGDGLVKLSWVTASEVDNQGFIIERALQTDSIWLQIASYEDNEALQGRGNASQQTTYLYVDNAVFNGITYLYKLLDVDVNGIRTEHRIISVQPTAAKVEVDLIRDTDLPDDYDLRQNYPNPCNPDTRIEFSLPEFDRISLEIFSITGKKMLTLFAGELAAGFYQVYWAGIDKYGVPVASGIYFYTISSKNYFATRKLIILR